ncbi:hypothetical protein GCM10020220_068980 [Nonomuraea rubra]|uniref:hypothetical protein n=1 Tax=Nonomuraea rubra TaxID=46180 RepID=UPI0031EAA058
MRGTRLRRPGQQRLQRTVPVHGGTINKVTVNVSGEHYVDHDLEGLAMLARD